MDDMKALILMALLWSGEIPLHETRGVAVVTLADPSRTDPTEFRWVLVNGRGEWSVLVDRETGRVLWCAEKHRPRVTYDGRGFPQIKYGKCVIVQGEMMRVVPR